MWLSTNHINHNLQGTTKGVVHAVPSFPLYAHCIYASYSICFLSVFGPTSQFFVSSLFSAPRLNLLYVVCFRPQVWIFCTKSIFGPTSEFLDLVSQLILRDLYRAKYAGSCPRIAQIFPNFPKWNIFLNQKVVIPERFGRVHTTLQSTYYQEVPMRKKNWSSSNAWRRTNLIGFVFDGLVLSDGVSNFDGLVRSSLTVHWRLAGVWVLGACISFTLSGLHLVPYERLIGAHL